MTDTYSGTYIMIGPPGTGKTHTLSRIVAKIMRGKEDRCHKDRSPILICSLTRTAAAEIAGRVELPEAAVATIHAHAYRSTPMPPLVGGELLDVWNKENPNYALSAAIFSKRTGEEGPSHGAIGDETFQEVDLLRNRLTPVDKWKDYHKHFHKVWTAWKEEHAVIDFTDMLELAADEPPMGAYYLFVDEAQDTSRLAFSVIQRWMRHATATFITGDPQQCLFQWAGGDPSILTDPDIPADHRAVLAQSYRVPRAVHAHATRFVRQLSDWQPIDYHPRRADPADKESPVVEGQVDYLGATWIDPGAAIDDAEHEVEDGRTVMFATSNNRMTNKIVWDLKERGLLFANPWRLTNGAWNPVGQRNGTSTMQRLSALLTPLSDGWAGEDTPEWSYGQLWAFLDVLKDTLARGGRKELGFWAKEKSTASATCPPERLWEWVQRGPFEDLLAYPDPLHWLQWWEWRLQKSREQAAAYPLKLVRSIVAQPFWSAEEIVNLEPKIFVGTIHSFKGAEADCSPGDEMVLTTNRGYVSMEALDPTKDKLVSFNSNHHKIHRGGPRRTGYSFIKKHREYEGPLITITTPFSRTRVTPNHHITVRWNQRAMDGTAVYLMKRGNWWRIGISVIRGRGRGGGVGGRLCHEKANEAWILKVFDTKKDALFYEQLLSHRFKVPDLTFESAERENRLSSADLQEIWNSIDSETPAHALLESFGMSPSWPMYKDRNGSKMRRRQTGIRNRWTIRAANLIDGYMEIPTDPGHGIAPRWTDFTTSTEIYSGTVYSLDVERWHHYISGGAVVHNCVYLFPDLPQAAMEACNLGDRDPVIRMFYVGMTRAKERLVIMRAASKNAVEL